MNFSKRNHLSPLVAILTLAFGMGAARTAGIIMSTFLSKPVEHAIASSAPKNEDQDSSSTSEDLLSCYDFNILPIWHELKRDAKFRHALETFPGNADCSELLRVEQVELDGDRFDEFIVWGKDVRFCGATGNCDVWVFDLANNRVSKLLSSNGIDVEVEKSKSQGFRNIVVRFNGSSYPDSLFDYKFDGHEYRLKKCYQQEKQTLNKWDETCEGWEDSLTGLTR